MSDYTNVTVSKNGKAFVTEATASTSDDAARILVWNGSLHFQLGKANNPYRIANPGGLFDTQGDFLGGSGTKADPWTFENVE